MTHECFNVTIANNIAHIQLSRPEKRNSMIPQFWTELPAIIQDIDAEAKARVIVISSTGPHFTSGLDVSSFAGVGQVPDADQKQRRLTAGAAFYDNVLVMQGAFNAIEACRIPVLAAIQGGCIGGGVDPLRARRVSGLDLLLDCQHSLRSCLADYFSGLDSADLQQIRATARWRTPRGDFTLRGFSSFHTQ